MNVKHLLVWLSPVLLLMPLDNLFGANDALGRQIAQLPAISLPLPEAQGDWLIDASPYRAQVCATADHRRVVITNGLVSRIFCVEPNLATVDFVNQMTGENLLRAVSGEGSVTVDGKSYNIGGLQGQPERGYIRSEWIDQLTTIPDSYMVESLEVSDNVECLAWAESRWALNHTLPTGKRLTFTMRGVGEVANTTIELYYDIYDSVPVIRKSFKFINHSGRTVTLDRFKLEELYFIDLESGDDAVRERVQPNIHVESDYACGGSFWKETSNITEHWVVDKAYTSQCNYGCNSLCTLEVAPNLGPARQIDDSGEFSSCHVCIMPIDTYDRERSGLFKRRMYRTLLPWTTENPIFMHLTSTDPTIVRRAVDQCAATGYEMIILSFGSGMNAETDNPDHIAKIKSLVDYAHSKGIEMGGYSLLASRSIGKSVDVVSPKTGTTDGAVFGHSPCICSEWGVDYLAKIKNFYIQTGLTLLEHDGSYPGDVCASTEHKYHNGLEDSQWKQFERIAELYHWALANGISLNVPDFYFMNGSTKTSIGYKEVNWSLPRDRQLIHGRQVNYIGTFDRMASMCWSFVPLVQYHGGGAAATLEPLSEHLKEYRQIMMQNYGAGVQACYRGPRLYDTDQTKQTVTEVIDWYKRYRAILNSDMIHISRADGRDWDGFVHVNPDLEQKGLAMFFNPTSEPITRTIRLPLYYTGLTDRASIRQGEGKAVKYKLSRDYTVTLSVTIPAEGYVWYVIE